jgi:hypothetical protein
MSEDSIYQVLRGHLGVLRLAAAAAEGFPVSSTTPPRTCSDTRPF